MAAETWLVFEHAATCTQELSVLDALHLIKEELKVRSDREWLENRHQLKLDSQGHLLSDLKSR
jgi:hypothetical protein